MDMLVPDRARQTKTIGNNLLRALKPADFAYIEPLLEACRGQAGEVLYEPGDNVGHEGAQLGRGGTRGCGGM